MFTVIFITAFGVLAGYLLRHFRGMQHINRSITFTIWFMLFVLGISVGENQLIVKNLWRFGVQALFIGSASVAGSVLVAFLLHRYVLGNTKKTK